jgi:hypothetical protein
MPTIPGPAAHGAKPASARQRTTPIRARLAVTMSREERLKSRPAPVAARSRRLSPARKLFEAGMLTQAVYEGAEKWWLAYCALDIVAQLEAGVTESTPWARSPLGSVTTLDELRAIAVGVRRNAEDALQHASLPMQKILPVFFRGEWTVSRYCSVRKEMDKRGLPKKSADKPKVSYYALRWRVAEAINVTVAHHDTEA